MRPRPLGVVGPTEDRTEADSYHASAVASVKVTFSVPRAMEWISMLKITVDVCTEQTASCYLRRFERVRRICLKRCKSVGLVYVKTKKSVGNVTEDHNKSGGYCGLPVRKS